MASRPRDPAQSRREGRLASQRLAIWTLPDGNFARLLGLRFARAPAICLPRHPFALTSHNSCWVRHVYGACELEHLTACAHHVSRDHLSEFLRYFTFIETVYHSLSKLLDRTGEMHKRSLKDIDIAVKNVVGFLDSKLGTKIDEATTPSSANLLGLNYCSGVEVGLE
eukprot:4406106-Pleurochrysis_carterae.AAC.9